MQIFMSLYSDHDLAQDWQLVIGLALCLEVLQVELEQVMEMHEALPYHVESRCLELNQRRKRKKKKATEEQDV